MKMSDDKENFKEKPKRGRKPNIDISSICRFCGDNLRNKLGTGFKSFINIFKASQREEFQYVIADHLRDLGFYFAKQPNLYHIVCLTCARKVNTFCKFYELWEKASCPSSAEDLEKKHTFQYIGRKRYLVNRTQKLLRERLGIPLVLIISCTSCI